MPLCEMPSEFPSLQMTKPEKEALSLFSLLLSKIQHKSDKSNVFQNKIDEIKHFNHRRSSPQKTERKCFKESYIFYLHKIQSHPFFLFGGTFSFFFFQQKSANVLQFSYRSDGKNLPAKKKLVTLTTLHYV